MLRAGRFPAGWESHSLASALTTAYLEKHFECVDLLIGADFECKQIRLSHGEIGWRGPQANWWQEKSVLSGCTWPSNFIHSSDDAVSRHWSWRNTSAAYTAFQQFGGCEFLTANSTFVFSAPVVSLRQWAAPVSVRRQIMGFIPFQKVR